MTDRSDDWLVNGCTDVDFWLVRLFPDETMDGLAYWCFKSIIDHYILPSWGGGGGVYWNHYIRLSICPCVRFCPDDISWTVQPFLINLVWWCIIMRKLELATWRNPTCQRFSGLFSFLLSLYPPLSLPSPVWQNRCCSAKKKKKWKNKKEERKNEKKKEEKELISKLESRDKIVIRSQMKSDPQCMVCVTVVVDWAQIIN